MSTVILLCNLWKKKNLQRVENHGGRTKLIKKEEEEEEEDRKYVRGKNHILLREIERACGCGARS